MNEDKLNERLHKIETDHWELLGGQTALSKQYDDLSRDQRRMARCVAEFQEQYGESIKATAADRAFVRGIKDWAVQKIARTIVWGVVLSLTASCVVGGLFFLRRWLDYASLIGW